ncbi:cysteine--tRNA ligase [Spiroplasma endosymbiont of Labia minor]|uniref:cysteine--tRNA ligase n=1 Tax=Spiroplasma endosymbiont of Labia minor TaxID=3066305 RepID=UPI0030D4F5E9
MKFYSSFSQREVELDDDFIKIYLCGPTVYSDIHIGNARPILLVDFFVRCLEFLDFQIDYMQNITDIDDKIINKARAENVNEEVIAKKYTDAYLDILKKLNIRKPNSLRPISQKIEKIIKFIDLLIEKEMAYEVNGNVYFSIDKYKDEYGKLSNKKLDELNIGKRIAIDKNKHNPLDFVIWKKTTEGKQWYTKWSKGRPGWHTECAVLIDNHFGSEGVDVHFGGVDLQFPHHENSRIQFLAKNKHEIAKIWMHNGHVTLGDAKMSKSLGNILTVKEFLKDNSVNELRYIFMTKNYRAPIDFNNDLLQQAKKWEDRIKKLLIKIRWQCAVGKIFITENIPIDEELNSYHFIANFKDYITNDLDLPAMITQIDLMVKHINQQLLFEEIDSTPTKLNIILNVLGFDFKLKELTKDEVNEILEWQQLLFEKKFDMADSLRKNLLERELL